MFVLQLTPEVTIIIYKLKIGINVNVVLDI